jgi:hypothetical protein
MIIISFLPNQVNCDVSTYIDGKYGDNSKMFYIGKNIDLRAQR